MPSCCRRRLPSPPPDTGCVSSICPFRCTALRAPRDVTVDGRPAYKEKSIDHWLVRLRYLLTRTAMYSVFFEPVIGGAGPADMDLYVAILIRAGQLARERYG